MTRASELLRRSDRQHLMLLYDDEHDRNSAEIECLNHALKAGQFCVYPPSTRTGEGLPTAWQKRLTVTENTSRMATF